MGTPWRDGRSCVVHRCRDVVLASGSRDAAFLSAAGVVTLEVIAGLLFVLHARTTAQMSHFHSCLDQTQRFLLPNSICASLDTPEARTEARRDLIRRIAQHRSSGEPDYRDRERPQSPRATVARQSASDSSGAERLQAE